MVISRGLVGSSQKFVSIHMEKIVFHIQALMHLLLFHNLMHDIGYTELWCIRSRQQIDVVTLSGKLAVMGGGGYGWWLLI